MDETATRLSLLLGGALMGFVPFIYVARAYARERYYQGFEEGWKRRRTFDEKLADMDLIVTTDKGKQIG